MIRRPAKTIGDVEKDMDKAMDKRKQDKEFYAERQSNGLYFLKLTAGGEVPRELSGVFTTASRAEAAAAAYVERRGYASAAS